VHPCESGYSLLAEQTPLFPRSLNISATGLSKHKPSASLLKTLAEGNKRKRDVDLDFVRSLPPDLRKEVMQQYGLTKEDLGLDEPPSKMVKIEGGAGGNSNEPIELDDDDDDDEPAIVQGKSKMDIAGSSRCKKCGISVFPFALAAHNRWHEE
jgi:hypothetical protein